jgi:hypothetical protein
VLNSAAPKDASPHLTSIKEVHLKSISWPFTQNHCICMNQLLPKNTLREDEKFIMSSNSYCTFSSINCPSENGQYFDLKKLAVENLLLQNKYFVKNHQKFETVGNGSPAAPLSSTTFYIQLNYLKIYFKS